MAQENTYPNNWVRPEGLEKLEALGFVGDTSPTNNACPGWSHKDINCTVWVDFPIPHSTVTWDPSIWYQYVIEHCDSQEQLLCTNDIDEVITFIKQETLKHCKLCMSIEAQHQGMEMVESYIESRRFDGLFQLTEPSPAGTPFEDVIANCHTPLHREDGMVRLVPDLGLDSNYVDPAQITLHDFTNI